MNLNGPLSYMGREEKGIMGCPSMSCLNEKCNSTWFEYLYPTIGVKCKNMRMQVWARMQEHNGTNQSIFSYDTILIGQLGCVPYTLHTTHLCEYGLTRQFAHVGLLVGRAFSDSSTFFGHPLALVTVTAVLCKT